MDHRADDFETAIRFASSLEPTSESADLLYGHVLRLFSLDPPAQRKHSRVGTLVTLDGHSGAGKDAQASLLVRALGRRGVPARALALKRHDPFRALAKYLWRHPELIERNDPSFLLLTCGRRFAVFDVVLPAHESPGFVVQVRSYLSHVAYHGESRAHMQQLLALCEHDPFADHALVLECDVDVAFARVVERAPTKGGVIYPNEERPFIARTRESFRRLSESLPNIAFCDASHDVEVVARDVGRAVGIGDL